MLVRLETGVVFHSYAYIREDGDWDLNFVEDPIGRTLKNGDDLATLVGESQQYYEILPPSTSKETIIKKLVEWHVSVEDYPNVIVKRDDFDWDWLSLEINEFALNQ
ncbi:MAG: hypothetical protein ACFFAS_00030 [Promethearchaeota archaeon]